MKKVGFIFIENILLEEYNKKVFIKKVRKINE